MKAGLGWAVAAIMLATSLGTVVQGVRNRQAAPGGTVELTERELPLLGMEGDSTALMLRLDWSSGGDEPGQRGAPPWFTRAKLAELGFDCRHPISSPHARDHYRSMPARLIYVVLDYAAGETNSPSGRGRAATRLLAVDAGNDAQALRVKYPNLARHIIVRGVVRPLFQEYDPVARKPLAEPRLEGWIQDVLPDLLFVPRPYSQMLQSLRSRPANGSDDSARPPRYAVTVSWGRHYEPWIRDVRLLTSAAGPLSGSLGGTNSTAPRK